MLIPLGNSQIVTNSHIPSPGYCLIYQISIALKSADKICHFVDIEGEVGKHWPKPTSNKNSKEIPRPFKGV